MKALYTASPGQYALCERPTPVPSATEALVRVTHAAICHTDLIIRSGRAGHVRYPVIPGHEFSGIVEACGAAVHRVSVGDAVAVETILSCGHCPACRKGDTNGCDSYDELGSRRDGGFAQFCAVPANHLHRLPVGTSLAEAALVEPLANAVSVVRQAAVGLGDRVVVIGPGPIGLLVLQVARLYSPSHLILVGTREGRLRVGQELGATHTVNIRQEGALERLHEILNGQGASVVTECAGTLSAFELATQLVGWRGRVAVEGVYDVEDRVSISPYSLLLSRAASVLGICGWVSADFGRALDLLQRHQVDLRALVTHTLALEDWQSAFDLVTQHKDVALKVELVP